MALFRQPSTIWSKLYPVVALNLCKELSIFAQGSKMF